MGEELETTARSRGYREYVWFAVTLVALMVCTAVNNTEPVAAQASFAAPESSVAR